MKVKNIIADCAQILGLGDVGEDSPDYSILFRCANLVAANAASSYLECIETKSFHAPTGRIEFSEFNRQVLQIKEVKMNGAVVRHELFMGFIMVPSGTVDVTYSFIPVFEDGEDEAGIVPMSGSAFVYGILAEYAFISGMFNEAKVWNQKFEDIVYGEGKTGRARKIK